MEDILRSINAECKVRHYKGLQKKDLQTAEKIIICGTSLKDFQYLQDLKKFEFLESFEKPVLGICAGMQIIALVSGCSLEKDQEIGLQKVNFEKEFFGFEGVREVYELHNSAIKEDKAFRNNFEVFARAKCAQAIKHKKKTFFGVLFHPEVRQKELIANFVLFQNL